MAFFGLAFSAFVAIILRFKDTIILEKTIQTDYTLIKSALILSINFSSIPNSIA